MESERFGVGGVPTTRKKTGEGRFERLRSGGRMVAEWWPNGGDSATGVRVLSLESKVRTGTPGLSLLGFSSPLVYHFWGGPSSHLAFEVPK